MSGSCRGGGPEFGDGLFQSDYTFLHRGEATRVPDLRCSLHQVMGAADAFDKGFDRFFAANHSGPPMALATIARLRSAESTV